MESTNFSGSLTYMTPPNEQGTLEPLATFFEDVENIGRIAWSPDGRLLAFPSANRSVRIVDWPARKTLSSLHAHDGVVRGVTFSPDGQMLAGFTEQGSAFVWDVRAARVRMGIDKPSAVRGVAFDPTGTVLAVCYRDGQVELWNVAEGHATHEFGSREIDGAEGIAFHPKSRHLAVISAYGLSIWNPWIRMDAAVRLPDPLSLAYSPNGKLMVVGAGATVQILEAATLRPIRVLEGHTQAVDFVQFSPDGSLLASKSNDDTVRLWRCDGWREAMRIEVLKNGRNWWPSLAFHPREPLLAVVRADDADKSERRDRMVDVLRYEIAPRSRRAAAASASVVSFTSAKVVLVGESNVGKSYLAHRLATGDKPKEGEIRSTHGMKFWPLEPGRLSKKHPTPKNERREVVLWDMGGQEEYRLVHQLFLHDTVVALILIDPTRGAAAFKEAETWNKYLDKQLQGKAVKLLVGSKMDVESDTVDRAGLDRLLREGGFHAYLECSAVSGRGIAELSEEIARAIDWKALGRTSRPELFQRIRDEVEFCRRSGRVVLPMRELWPRLGIVDDEDDKRAVEAVTSQLATQGVIARSRVSSGEPVLVLQVQEIERYAGSLILAARGNERGVPALELRAIAQPGFVLPGIPPKQRLERHAEQLVLESTVQLMLEYGLCFQHEGLLVFPTLFAPAASSSEEVSLPHAVSLYYDFAGAIDNTYASLVAWLVLARDFGRVRLWADRAEFETKDHGLCGLRKVTRAGGFAHVDVYFEAATPPDRRKEFIQFVEDHLATNGVEIREHISIKCHVCHNQIGEETLRQRIARGEKDVTCPVCETRHPLDDGAAGSRTRDPDASKRMWALRTQVAKTRELVTQEAVRVLEQGEAKKTPSRPIRLLHLSDLHFSAQTPVEARLQWLLDDVKSEAGLGFDELDYLLISGDFTDRGNLEGFDKAYDFVSGLTKAFGLSAQRCIFVPGNHDVVDSLDAYRRCRSEAGLRDGEWVRQGAIVMARDPDKYAARFKAFSDGFFHKFLQIPYPLAAAEQGFAIPFWDTGLQFLTLNSCWQIDEFHRNRAGIHNDALANVVREARAQEAEARKNGLLARDRPVLRIATWHHGVTAPDYKMDSIDFLGNLQKLGVKLALHGDVHDMRREIIGHWHPQGLHVVGGGSFGARAPDRPESTPRLYNVIEIERDLRRATVHTRHQRKPDGPWDGWHEWPAPGNPGGRIASYEIPLGRATAA